MDAMNMENKLEALKEQMLGCQSCDLYRTRKNVVFGEGSLSPLIMLLGEGPGEQEDLQGRPFVGASGEKLDKILSYIGISRNDLYIANSVLCRPPNNRVPRQEELEACRWRLDLQIKLLKPKVIVLLGKTAFEQLSGKPIKGPLKQYFFDKISTNDGWLTYQTGDHIAKTITTYHPAYILRNPEKGYREVLPHWNKIKQWIQNEKQTN